MAQDYNLVRKQLLKGIYPASKVSGYLSKGPSLLLNWVGVLKNVNGDIVFANWFLTQEYGPKCRAPMVWYNDSFRICEGTIDRFKLPF